MSEKKPKLKWDKWAHASYITITDKPVTVTQAVNPVINIDYDEFGDLVGVEIL